MKRLQLNPPRELDERALKLRSATHDDFDELICEPTLLYEGDKLLVAYESVEDGVGELLAALRSVEYHSTFRTAGLKTTSRTVGFQPRVVIRRDFCGTTSLARENPGAHAIICSWGAHATAAYLRHNPTLLAQHEELMAKVLPCWRMPASVFTSGIVNWNNQLYYHYDTGNFQGVWSAMVATAHDMKGGHLVMPAYRVAFDFSRPRLILFDGQGLLHGVLPFHKESERAYRYSVVFYSLQQMCNCGTPKEELERIRRVKTEREHKRAKKEA